MVEAGAKEISEDVILDALMFAHEAIKELCEFKKKLKQLFVLKKKRSLTILDPDAYEIIKKKKSSLIKRFLLKKSWQDLKQLIKLKRIF